jgi:SAM-dependent methyltransferase
MGLYARHLRPRLLDATLADAHTGPTRSRVCAGLSGDVLEIGFGSGRNLPHLPPQVRSVLAVEPSEVALRLAAGRRAASPVAVVVVGDDAQDLPLPDGSVDARCRPGTSAASTTPVRHCARSGASCDPAARCTSSSTAWHPTAPSHAGSGAGTTSTGGSPAACWTATCRRCWTGRG